MKLRLLLSYALLSSIACIPILLNAQCTLSGAVVSVASTNRTPGAMGTCTYDVTFSLNASEIGLDYSFTYDGDGVVVGTNPVVVTSPGGPIEATFVVEADCDAPGDASATIVGSGGATIDLCGQTTGPLPVELSIFEAKSLAENNQIQLYWRTNSELDNEGFEVERSTDAKNWKTLDFVVGYGTTTEVQEYEWYDEAPLNIAYYRLKQYDFSGAFEYSHIVSVQQEQKGESELEVYPNPTTDVLHYQLTHADVEDAALRLYDQFGRLVRQWQADGDMVSIADIPSGIYLLMLQNGREQYHQRIIKR